MGSIKIMVMEKYLRPLKAMAKEYGLGMSDLSNEIFEWVLDKERAFRRDLERDLLEESEEEESEEEEEEEEEEEAE